MHISFYAKLVRVLISTNVITACSLQGEVKVRKLHFTRGRLRYLLFTSYSKQSSVIRRMRFPCFCLHYLVLTVILLKLIYFRSTGQIPHLLWNQKRFQGPPLGPALMQLNPVHILMLLLAVPLYPVITFGSPKRGFLF